MAFGLDGVIYAALLTPAALAPRAVAPCFHLVFKLSTFRAFLPCIYRLFSHIPYYSIIALVWTLPAVFSLPPLRGAARGRFLYKARELRDPDFATAFSFGGLALKAPLCGGKSRQKSASCSCITSNNKLLWNRNNTAATQNLYSQVLNKEVRRKR